MADIVVQVVTDDVVTNVIVAHEAVTISADGKTLVGIPGGDLTIPAGDNSVYMMQPDAGIGWTFDSASGDLVAPPPTEPPPGSIISFSQMSAKK
jgi:hypothetical protein